MFKDDKSYQKAVKRVAELRDLECNAPLSQNDAYELEVLTVAVMEFEYAVGVEYRAEQEFMRKYDINM